MWDCSHVPRRPWCPEIQSCVEPFPQAKRFCWRGLSVGQFGMFLPAAWPLYPLYGRQPLLVVMTKTSVMFPTSLFSAMFFGRLTRSGHCPQNSQWVNKTKLG